MKHSVFYRVGLVLAIAAAAGAFSETASAEQKHPLNFESLKQRMLKEDTPNLDARYIRSVFDSPRLEFAAKGISSYFQHRESKLNYGQFTKNYSIDKAEKYMKTYQDTLARAEETFGVSGEVIVSILLVETRLGSYTGNQNVLNILATMAALEDQSVREQFWQDLPEENRISRDLYEKKAESKAKWAYRQLKAYLEYTRNQGMDPFSLPGSYAGAIGIAQFMPTNILLLGEDGNQDGRVDMFNHHDAIFSIARFLSRYGWESGISREKAKKVVMYYNRSTYYADTILDIAEKLKG
ncbi:MAG: lytic murein transglycosylase [Desulfobacteraceae bacterium]|nr:lytic murein transglycosylase [Desulfobacteraceae bacterium]